MSIVADLAVRPVAKWLAPPSDPAAVLRGLTGSAGLVGLIGAWAGVGALITTDPVVVSGQDPISELAAVPRLLASAPDDFVGGGWFGSLAFQGPSYLAFYDHVLRLRADGWYFEALVSDQRDALLQARCEEYAGVLDAPGGASIGWDTGSFRGADRDAHLGAVEQAIEAIRAGDIYQANVCTRLNATFSGSAAELFGAAVRQLSPAYAAYVDGPEVTIASLSPELFLRRRGRDVRSAPIKGTAPDVEGGAEQLRRSVKDAAENVMIVDLVRNDLGAVAATGSVTVPELLSVQPHAGVWQLVSTVAAQLAEGVGDDALLRATFPPGSVTGAPKSSALRVIAEVESLPRGAYTGAIGFTSPVWGAEFSVAIRTFEIAGAAIELGVGGGVTADSVPMLEWHECLAKATPLLSAIGAGLEVRVRPSRPSPEQLAGGLLETILAIDGRVLRLGDHLARLDRSCRELYGQPAPGFLADEVKAAAAGQAGRLVLRAIVAPAGRALRGTVTRASAGSTPDQADARTVVRGDGIWRHKWADRSALSADEAALGWPLYLDSDGAVLETSRGNVVLIGADGTLVTPPLRDELLPGITRRALLDIARDTGRTHEIRAIHRDELLASAAFWTSSVSLAVPIASLDGVDLPREDELVARLRDELSRGGVEVR